MICGFQESADTEQDGLAHREKRKDHFIYHLLIAVSRLLEDDDVATDAFESLCARGGSGEGHKGRIPGGESLKRQF